MLEINIHVYATYLLSLIDDDDDRDRHTCVTLSMQYRRSAGDDSSNFKQNQFVNKFCMFLSYCLLIFRSFTKKSGILGQ